MANHYIRAGATGAANGSNWEDAWTAFPEIQAGYVSVKRGDTYYVADGSYVGWWTRKSGIDISYSSTAFVNIKKAIESDHGTETGWNTSYGTGQAVFTTMFDIIFPNFLFDGQTGSGTSGYGIKFQTDGSRYGMNIIATSSVYIRYIEIDCGGEDIDISNTGGIKVTSTLGTYNSDIRISNCYIHDTSTTMLLLNNTKDSIYENNYLARRHTNNPSIHGEAMSINGDNFNTNNIIRNNIIEDVYGTGAIVIMNGDQSDYNIYNNLIFTTNSSRYIFSNGAIANTTADSSYNINVYNNTIANYNNSINSGIYWAYGTNNIAINNLFFNCYVRMDGTESYNMFVNCSFSSVYTPSENDITTSTVNPFVDSTNYDFRLKSDSLAIGSGTARLASTDILGNTFITNDIGAYAYIPEYNYYANFTTIGDTLTIEIWGVKN